MKKLMAVLMIVASFNVMANGRGVRLETDMAKCRAVKYALGQMLNTFVNLEDARTCRQDDDCTIAATGGFCGRAVVNTTAAAGYELYFADEKVQQLLEEKRRVCGRGPVGLCMPMFSAKCDTVQKTCVPVRRQ